MRIAKRICGEEVVMKDIETPETGVFKKLAGIFR
jgi:septum formation inhibitor-activating ATPase MinD